MYKNNVLLHVTIAVFHGAKVNVIIYKLVQWDVAKTQNKKNIGL